MTKRDIFFANNFTAQFFQKLLAVVVFLLEVVVLLRIAFLLVAILQFDFID